MNKGIADWYGWRAKLGIIYTSSSTIMESEFYAMAPRGVSSHTSRVYLGRVTADELIQTGVRAVEAARLLATAPLQAIVFGCTSGSFLMGPDYDRELAKELSEVTNPIPVTTTTTAVVRALEALDLSKIVIATPYTDDINERACGYFDAIGHEIMGVQGLQITTDLEMTQLSPEKIYQLARSSWNPDADGMVISCTSLRTIEILEALEADIGKPVISANQASFWAALRMAGVHEAVPGFGQLLMQ
jgi:maleate isomerase